MPVPKSVFEQIKRFIPPLDGTLHKGQSGASPEMLPFLLTSEWLSRACRCLGRLIRVRVHQRSCDPFAPTITGLSYTGAPFFAAITALRIVHSFRNSFLPVLIQKTGCRSLSCNLLARSSRRYQI